ncbi:MAG: alpha/beta fold hydrolase [Oscillibacter sp.]|nr:alpha/beta fold hydrolase [Oscillibacter sp.]
MVRSEFLCPSSDGHTLLHAAAWLPNGMDAVKTPKAVLQIAHGVAEHILRYEPLAEYLTDRGFVVTGNDHLGHGTSVPEGGVRLYMGPRGSWFRAVDDIESLRRRTKERFPAAPYFLLGHSMGSFLARTYLIRYPGALNGCILMGTGQPSRALLAAGRRVAEAECRRVGETKPSVLADRLAFGAYGKPFAPNRTSRDWLSVNEENVDRFLASPLCGGTPATGLLREMLDGMLYNSRLRNLRRMDPDTPVLFVSGAEDPVGDMGAGVRRAAALFRRAGVWDMDVRLYPGLRHEILNEAPESREQVMRDLAQWMNTACPSS